MFDDLKVLYEEEEIQKRIGELAKEVDEYYGDDEDIVLISVLNGAMFFTTDLMKKMKTRPVLDTIQTASYIGTESTKKVMIRKDIDTDISGKKVLIVEDIIDSGRTLKKLREYFSDKDAKEIKIVVLLDKPERRVVDVHVDYVGFSIPNKFVVGYGFDIDGKGRNIPYIGYFDK